MRKIYKFNWDTLSIHNKLLLYNTCILPIITYGSLIWDFTCKTHMTNLSRLHNKNLRTVRNGFRYIRNSTIRRDLNIITLRKHIVNPSTFFSKICNLSNVIVAELPDYGVSDPQNRKRPKYSMI